eukprot:SAG11_NODE_2612_length_3172_cov_3.416206_2_plen_105_part_00
MIRSSETLPGSKTPKRRSARAAGGAGGDGPPSNARKKQRRRSGARLSVEGVVAVTPQKRTAEAHHDVVLAAVAKSTSTVSISGKPTAAMIASRSQLLADVEERH